MPTPMPTALVLAAVLLAPPAPTAPRAWTAAGVRFELSADSLRATREGLTLFSTTALLDEDEKGFAAVAEEQARELLGPHPPSLPSYEYTASVAYEPLSAIGPLVTLLESGDGYAPGAAHPYAYRRFVVRDVTRAAARPSLLDFYTEEQLVAALAADRWIRGFVHPSRELRSVATLKDLASHLNDAREAGASGQDGCARDAFFTEDLVERFAFHHLDGERVAVRIAIPYAVEICRPTLHQVGLLLPVPKALRADLLAAAGGEAGFLMKDVAALGAPRYARSFERDIRALSRTLESKRP